MYDLLVVGAGPYGLSIASHAAAAGLSLRVFGGPMASWRDHMPAGMYLKSEPWASNLSDPGRRRRLDTYCATRGVMARFVHGATFTAGTLVRGVRRRLRAGVPGGDRIPAPGGRSRQDASGTRPA